MIHYHGTPISGRDIDAARSLKGRHGLVSYANPKQLPIVAEVCSSWVLDSGAYSVWRHGGTLDVEGYTSWVRRWSRHPGFDWALIPDVIDGTEEDNEAMLKRWPRDLRGVPVWHLHESLDRLARLVLDWEFVAIGSSGKWATPGTSGWWERMSMAMAVACDGEGRPMARLHGLRMLNPEIFTRLPLSSADSSNAGRNASTSSRFGSYPPPSPGARASIIMDRIEAQNSAAVWRGRYQLGLWEAG